LNLELEILTVEKEKLQVRITIHKLGKRQLELENEYIIALEKLF